MHLHRCCGGDGISPFEGHGSTELPASNKAENRGALALSSNPPHTTNNTAMGSPPGLSTRWNSTITAMVGASSTRPKAGARFVSRHSAPTGGSMPFRVQLDVLETEVLNLSSVDRSHLLDRLVASLEADSGIADVWALEAGRRDAEIEAGQVALVPGNPVLARLGAQLL